jgi:hypothetical protein
VAWLGRTRSYTTYSVAVWVVWAVLLIVVATVDPPDTVHNVLLVFGGFAIGWTSATIARVVYPPPKRYRQTSG